MAQKIVEIPSDIKVRLNLPSIIVKGPLGEIERNFYFSAISITHRNNKIIIEAPWPDKKRSALVGTLKSHIENMIIGVLKGFTYKLKIVFAHFPISVKIQDREIIIENFGGERKSRIAFIRGDVKVSVDGDDLIVKGICIEDVSQTAANVEQGTRIKNKDPRVFLDGIYVFEKGEGM
ncbi:50S ribosomal protein L6 [Candidatus Bathyarchaeota archaeon]|nr:MAG: 50S ribosomal protein L6 [Candidatus Bathyarchaeota archaeon]